MSDVLLNALRARLGPEGFTEASDAGRAFDLTTDICGRRLGRPLAVVAPADAAEVEAIVALCHDQGVQVVACGEGTAYWQPLDLAGAVALRTHRLVDLPAVPADGAALWCGAGVPVRVLDDHLRRSGRCLAAHPDGFGETSIGALVATGMAAGVGMARAAAPDLVAGLRVVLGHGAALETGACAVLGAPPATSVGLPDLTGLFIAAEGALGIITAVAVRHEPIGARAQVSAVLRPLAPEPLIAVLEALREPRTYDTLRVVRELGPHSTPCWQLDMRLHSPRDGVEARSRAAAAASTVRSFEFAEDVEHFNEEHRPEWRWQGPMGATRSRLAGMRFAALDVDLAWRDLPAALRCALALQERALALPHRSLRVAVYAAPEHVNVGMHFAMLAGNAAEEQAILSLLEAGREALARVSVLPYRWGGSWGPHFHDRLDPGYRAALRAIASAFDPAGVIRARGVFADVREGATVQRAMTSDQHGRDDEP